MCSIFCVRCHWAFTGHHLEILTMFNESAIQKAIKLIHLHWRLSGSTAVQFPLISLCILCVPLMKVINKGRIRNPISLDSLTWP